MNHPVGKRREKQKAETHALILESAKSLFEADGYEKTTMRAVAFHAEIGLGTIYKHFSNKISLLAAAFSDDLKRQYEISLATVPAHGTFQKQYLHICKNFFAFYASRTALSRAYLSHLFFFEDDGLDQINAFDDAYAEKISHLVRAAQKRGEINPEKDCYLVGLSLMSNYFFVLINYFLRQKSTDPEEMVDFLEKLIEQTLI